MYQEKMTLLKNKTKKYQKVTLTKRQTFTERKAQYIQYLKEKPDLTRQRRGRRHDQGLDQPHETIQHWAPLNPDYIYTPEVIGIRCTQSEQRQKQEERASDLTKEERSSFDSSHVS